MVNVSVFSVESAALMRGIYEGMGFLSAVVLFKELTKHIKGNGKKQEVYYYNLKHNDFNHIVSFHAIIYLYKNYQSNKKEYYTFNCNVFQSAAY